MYFIITILVYVYWLYNVLEFVWQFCDSLYKRLHPGSFQFSHTLLGFFGEIRS